MKTWILILIAVIVLFAIGSLVFLNSPRDISEVKNDEFVGETVKVRGEVKNVIKIGSLSGFTLEDSTGNIAVSSKYLPQEGEKMSVKGVLIKDSLFGYYIKLE